MANQKDSKTRLALTAIGVLIGGAGLLDVSAFTSDYGMLMWVITLGFLVGSIIIFTLGADGAILLNPGLVLTANSLFTFVVGGFYI